MRLIFLNRFYWPEEPATAQLLTDLAEALAAAGHEVTVIASPRREHAPARELHRGVTILRVASTRWNRLGLAGKAVDFVTFYCSALAKLVLTVQRGDTVVALTDPPLLGIGTWFTARMCGARIYHWVQDIYPEIAATLTGQSWLNLVKPFRDLAWRRSDGCVTLGSDMATRVAQAGVDAGKLHVSSNWAPQGLIVQPRSAADALRAAWQLEGKFVVAYAGNLGRVHDLGPVLNVAEALRGEPDIAFVFVGGGAQRARLENDAATRGLTSVHFHPAQPRDRLGALLALGDVHLVTLLPGCEQLVFPSKLYGVAAAGRPVLFIGPAECEIARLVGESGMGRAFTRDEPALIAGAIRELRANTAARVMCSVAVASFSADHIGPERAVAEWQNVLAPAD